MKYNNIAVRQGLHENYKGLDGNNTVNTLACISLDSLKYSQLI